MQRDIPPIIEDFDASPVKGRMANALTQIKWALAYMHDVQEMRAPAALKALALAKQLRRYAKSLEEVFDLAALTEMEHSRQTAFAAEGIQAVLRTGGERKDWQNESVVNELVDRYVAANRVRFPDVSSRDLRQIAQGAANQIVAAGRTEWRSTSLREMGVDPDEFSVKVETGRRSVDLRGEASYIDAKDLPTRKDADHD